MGRREDRVFSLGEILTEETGETQAQRDAVEAQRRDWAAAVAWADKRGVRVPGPAHARLEARREGAVPAPPVARRAS